MKKNVLKTVFLSFVLSTTTLLNAQVTIGSLDKPIDGALLDLKESGTTTKGLSLPRVELKKIDKLIMGTTIIKNEDNGGDQYEKHTGLIVFNVSEESPFCPGLYVWNGAQWDNLMGKCSGLNISASTPLDFPSGRDLRSLVGKEITVKWDPATGVISFDDATNNATNNATLAKVKFTNANVFSPALSVLKNAEGSKLTITPDAMTEAEVSDNGGNPFTTKQSKFSLTLTDGSKVTKSNELVITQTNKALLSDGKYTVPMIKEFGANAVGTKTATFDITSNGVWRVKELIPATNNGIDASSIKIDNTAITLPSGNYGEEKEDNKGHDALTLSFDYTMGIGSTKVPYSKLILEDTQSPKRFNDLMYTVYQCTSLKDTSVKWPTMSEWAEIAGYPNVKEKDVYNADYAANAALAEAEDELAGIGKIHPITGISWHRDQDGNIFLAASFHPTDMTKERWMITNLAATKYDTESESLPTGLNALTGPSPTRDHKNPLWSYPSINDQGSEATTYTKNPRVGLLYNWPAATAGKGGADGQAAIYDGNAAPTTAMNVQGICPNGWHLPQDGEFTDLENLIIQYSDQFSQYASPIGGAALTYDGGAQQWRGSLHGKAMQEGCAHYNTIQQGQSNPISVAERPGFEWMLAGNVSGGAANTHAYGTGGYIWASSGSTTYDAWCRRVFVGYSTVSRWTDYRYYHLSVRCKKNDL